MDYDAYRRAYFVDPAPDPRFGIVGVSYVALFIADYARALSFYEGVLGPPGYVEGDSTRGWRLGRTWLTLFPAKDGGPRNAEFAIETPSVQEAERLQRAFADAGAEVDEPSDQLMFEPMRFCPVRDPFGTSILVYAPLPRS
jgi:catechol 2,3-dioxygenase-like lactoylglutathione lyase family enzyme